MLYRVKQISKTFTQAGPSPTIKAGNDAGNVSPSTVFSASLPAGVFNSPKELNGWLSILTNRWVQKSSCEVYVVEDPDDPPPVELERVQIRYIHPDGTASLWKEYEEIP